MQHTLLAGYNSGLNKKLMGNVVLYNIFCGNVLDGKEENRNADYFAREQQKCIDFLTTSAQYYVK